MLEYKTSEGKWAETGTMNEKLLPVSELEDSLETLTYTMESFSRTLTITSMHIQTFKLLFGYSKVPKRTRKYIASMNKKQAKADRTQKRRKQREQIGITL